ncbi:MAG: hypothetical protein Q8R07_05485 [Candidatus Uhrbacteria bacterium]|nr:hypothetical protein [Candidatus Uhrbacteria bacterium]
MLYIRVNKGLIEELDLMLVKERAENPGYVISRSDLVRDLLYWATGAQWKSNV